MKRIVLILEVDDVHARLTRQGDEPPLVLLRHEVTRITTEAIAARITMWGAAVQAEIQCAMDDKP